MACTILHLDSFAIAYIIWVERILIARAINTPSTVRIPIESQVTIAEMSIAFSLYLISVIQ